MKEFFAPRFLKHQFYEAAFFKTMKKKIIIVSPDYTGLGGISKVVSIWRDADFFAGYETAYIGTTTIDAGIGRKLFDMIKALLRFVLFLPSADLVYIHTASSASFYRKSIFIILASAFRKKCVLHIHPSEFFDFVEAASIISRRYVFFVLGKVNTFVVLTETMQNYISTVTNNKRVHVIKNAVNVKEMGNTLLVQRDNAKLLYLGWYIPEKGVYDLVDAIHLMKQTKDMEVTLNFYGTKEIRQLTEYVNSKLLDSTIIVNGWVTGENKLRALYSSALLVLPSHSEGIPNVILEAMAKGTPIIATSVGGLKEILRDGENALIVQPKNPDDLMSKIVQLLNDQEFRCRIADNAYKDVLEKYDVPVIKKQVVSLISQL